MFYNIKITLLNVWLEELEFFSECFFGGECGTHNNDLAKQCSECSKLNEHNEQYWLFS